MSPPTGDFESSPRTRKVRRMTEKQTFWFGLLLQMRKLQPEVDIYTEDEVKALLRG